MAQDLSVQMMMDKAAKVKQSKNLAPRGSSLIPPRMQPAGTPNRREAVKSPVQAPAAKESPASGAAKPFEKKNEQMKSPAGNEQANMAQKQAAMQRAMAK